MTEETQYIDLIKEVLEHGITKEDRTGTGTISLFGKQMRFDLSNQTIPLLTTKRVFWRGVVEELLWIISGCTDTKKLSDKGIKIWDDNSSRSFLDNLGFTEREIGDAGPIYGYQFRHFGAKYVDCNTDYTGKGIDQLAECIRKIKECPNDRRIIINAWNVSDLNQMVLPPCHMFCQFYVDTTHNKLNCQMYQRSADIGLGVPFNIASYSLLTHMIAHVCGLEAGEFIHVLGDTHIYTNHVEALRSQITRDPMPFPKLKIKRIVDNIDDFTPDDFELIGYKHHAPISMKMAI